MIILHAATRGNLVVPLALTKEFSIQVFFGRPILLPSICISVYVRDLYAVGWFPSYTAAYDNIGRCRRQRLFLAYYSSFMQLTLIYECI